MKLFLKILFFLLAIFQTNISEAKVFVFNEAVSELKLNTEIVECKNEIFLLSENVFGITCKSENYLVPYGNLVLSVKATAAKTSSNVLLNTSRQLQAKFKHAGDFGVVGIETVKLYYSFLETEFGFSKTNETINGNAFYDVEFGDKERIISISYENIEDHLEVIVFLLQNGKMPDYDDKTKTLHLKQLNMLVMAKASKEEINLNAEYFAKYNAKNELERKLLKEAKELRLCLKLQNLSCGL